jgi:hypothetical protein
VRKRRNSAGRFNVFDQKDTINQLESGGWNKTFHSIGSHLALSFRCRHKRSDKVFNLWMTLTSSNTVIFEIIHRAIGRSAELVTALVCSQRLKRRPFARLLSTVDLLRSGDKEHASSITGNRLPLNQPGINAKLWDFLDWPLPHLCRVWSNRRDRIYPMLRIKTPLFIWWQSGILYISSGSRKISKKTGTVASEQAKGCPEQSHRKTKKVSENSLTIEIPRQSFCKISCISIYHAADRPANAPFVSKVTVHKK